VNRKLILLNAALLAIVVFAGVQLRKQWKAAKARERAQIGRPMKVLPSPPYQPIQPQAPVTPSGYIAIADKMLFDRSRDSKVVIEPPPPAPPPPPMPALPLNHGMMNIGGNPMAILSLGKGAHQAVHPGETIGQFKLVAVSSEVIEFEWEGKQVRRNTSEMLSASSESDSEPKAPAARNEAPAPVAAPVRQVTKGPGEDTGRGFRVCSINDGNAEGTVIDGYRKAVYTTPFGQSCRWEPVK
jgi:hypothetical protein